MNIMNKEIKTKICTKCNRELSIDNFSKYNKAKDGLQSWCRGCSSKYRQINKEHISQYQKEWQQINKEHISQYQRQYNQINKEHRNQYRNQYYSQFKGYYVYIILDKQGNVVYVGETTNYYKRLMNHLSVYVNATKELFASGEWSKIKYLDVGHIVENEMELRALENELIELYEPKLNKTKNIIHDIDRGRLFNLLAQLHSILNEWIVFKTNITNR